VFRQNSLCLVLFQRVANLQGAVRLWADSVESMGNLSAGVATPLSVRVGQGAAWAQFSYEDASSVPGATLTVPYSTTHSDLSETPFDWAETRMVASTVSDNPVHKKMLNARWKRLQQKIYFLWSCFPETGVKKGKQGTLSTQRFPDGREPRNGSTRPCGGRSLGLGLARRSLGHPCRHWRGGRAGSRDVACSAWRAC
jgi:hypothetical protein